LQKYFFIFHWLIEKIKNKHNYSFTVSIFMRSALSSSLLGFSSVFLGSGNVILIWPPFKSAVTCFISSWFSKTGCGSRIALEKLEKDFVFPIQPFRENSFSSLFSADTVNLIREPPPQKVNTGSIDPVFLFRQDEYSASV